MIVAAEHAERERIRAGQDMKEGLLFDGIALESGHVSPRHAEFAAHIRANFANAAFALADEATMAARDAADRVPLGIAELAEGGALIEHVRLGIVGDGTFFHGASRPSRALARIAGLIPCPATICVDRWRMRP